jgi:hypothetical protein
MVRADAIPLVVEQDPPMRQQRAAERTQPCADVEVAAALVKARVLEGNEGVPRVRMRSEMNERVALIHVRVNRFAVVGNMVANA